MEAIQPGASWGSDLLLRRIQITMQALNLSHYRVSAVLTWITQMCANYNGSFMFGCVFRSLEQISVAIDRSGHQTVFACILQVWSNYWMLLVGHIVNIYLYVTSMEKLFDAIDRSDRWYLLVFYKYWATIPCHWSVRSLMFACILQVLINDPMPLIGQTFDISLYFISLA